MVAYSAGWWTRRILDRAAGRWRRLAEAARRDGRVSEHLRDQARELQRDLARYVQQADLRLTRARARLHTMVLPAGTDWRWRPAIFSAPMHAGAMTRPAPGCRLGDEVALYHDCAERALMLRQLPNRHALDMSPFGLRLEVFGFTGSYLSLSLDLPAESRDGLDRGYVVRLEAGLLSERPITVYARLNVGQGPNTETMLFQMGDPIGPDRTIRVTEFDLGFADLANRAVDKMWLDLIFEAPQMNAVTVTDLVMSRHPRADM